MRTPLGKMKPRKGATVVELAVVCIPFIFMVFAIFEYGRYTMMRNLVDNAAREGARLAIVNTDVKSNSSNKTTKDIIARVTDSLANQVLLNVSVKVYHADTQGIKINHTDGNGAELTDAWQTKATYQHNIAVEVSADYQPMLPTLGFLSKNGSNTVPLYCKAVMRSEGQ